MAFTRRGWGEGKTCATLKQGHKLELGQQCQGLGSTRVHVRLLSRKRLDPYTELSTAAKVSNVFWPPAGDPCSKELCAAKQAELLNVCWFSGRCGAPQQRQLYPPRAKTRQELAELLLALPGARHSWTHQLSQLPREQHFLPGEIYQLIPPSGTVTLSLEDPGGVPKHHTHTSNFTAPFLKS